MIATISAIRRGWVFEAIAIAVELQEFRLGLKVVSNGTEDQKRGIFKGIAEEHVPTLDKAMWKESSAY